MKFLLLVPLAALALVPLAAQAPHVHTDALGFTFTLPEDWQIIVPKPQPAAATSPPDEVRKGIDCMNVPLTATHGNPATVIVIVTLPFDCFGQTMSQQDLPGFGIGVTEGLKVAFDILNPVEATYTLAGHAMWIERVKATPKGLTAPVFTVETTCTLLEKGAACWMAQAGDEAGLTQFEHGLVTLEGSTASQIVPESTFVKPQ
jgi:hypothetical protein